jgi:hypothetical protein
MQYTEIPILSRDYDDGYEAILPSLAFIVRDVLEHP